MTSRILSGINKTFEAKKKKKQKTVNQTTDRSARLPDESIADYQERQRYEAEVRARSKAAREREAREQAAREQAAREQAAREQAAKEQAAREQAAKEQAAREQAAKEQAAKEQAAKERAAKEQAARKRAAAELQADILNRTDPSGRIEPTISNRNLPSTKPQKKPSRFARRALAVPSAATAMYYGSDVFDYALDKISGAVNKPTSKPAPTPQPPSEPATLGEPGHGSTSQPVNDPSPEDLKQKLPKPPSTSEPAAPTIKSTDTSLNKPPNLTTIDIAGGQQEPWTKMGPDVDLPGSWKPLKEKYLAQFKKIIDYDE